MRQRWIYSSVMAITTIAVLHFAGIFNKPLGEALVWSVIIAGGLGAFFGLTTRWLRLRKTHKAD